MNQRCKVCGYEWNSRVDLPKQCPNCKRNDWNSLHRKRKPESTEILREAWNRLESEEVGDTP